MCEGLAVAVMEQLLLLAALEQLGLEQLAVAEKMSQAGAFDEPQEVSLLLGSLWSSYCSP